MDSIPTPEELKVSIKGRIMKYVYESVFEGYETTNDVELPLLTALPETMELIKKHGYILR